MGNPLEEELSEADDYNNRVVRSVAKSFRFSHQYQNRCLLPKWTHFSLKGVSRTSEAGRTPCHSRRPGGGAGKPQFKYQFLPPAQPLGIASIACKFLPGVGRGHITFIHRNKCWSWQEAEEDSEDASDLDEELFNDPDTQEIIRNLVL